MTPEGDLHHPANDEDGRDYESKNGAKLRKEKQSSVDGCVSGAEEWEEPGVEDKPAFKIVSRDRRDEVSGRAKEQRDGQRMVAFHMSLRKSMVTSSPD